MSTPLERETLAPRYLNTMVEQYLPSRQQESPSAFSPKGFLFHRVEARAHQLNFSPPPPLNSN